MSDEQFDEQVKVAVETIRQQLALLKEQTPKAWHESTAALEGLQLVFEEMRTELEAAELLEEELLQQNQRIAGVYQHYYDLFQTAPVAYLITDTSGIIREANQTAADLLNVPQSYLPGRPLVLYIEESRRQDFWTCLNSLGSGGKRNLSTELCPRPRRQVAIAVELYIDPIQNESGEVATLRIGVYTSTPVSPQGAQPPLAEEPAPYPAQPPLALSQGLDGLRVLVVDDEPDVREFLAAVLGSQGIEVRTVASAAAALEALQQFHPDVLVSDLRMPNGDGYSLIRQIRAQEAEQGGHIAAAAITAYLDEDREKALTAGFEAHLHKLAQPDELVDLVTQLAALSAADRVKE